MQTGSRGIRLLNIIPTRDDVPRPAWERDSASAGICLKGHVVYLIMAPLIVYSYISISICRFILIFISITVISNTAAISFCCNYNLFYCNCCIHYHKSYLCDNYNCHCIFHANTKTKFSVLYYACFPRSSHF